MPASDAARIGVVLHDFAAGGTERIAIRLANDWAGRGRAVTLFCGSVEGPARGRVGAGVEVEVASPPIRRGPGSRARLGGALRAMLAARPVDVLVAPGNFHLPVLRAAGRLPCAVVCKLSNPLERPGRSGLARLAFLHGVRQTARHVDRFVAMSPALADEACRLVRTDVVTLAEPILTQRPGPRPPRAAGPPLVVCAARLVPQKNVGLVVDAVALGPPTVRLVILGDGPERAALSLRAARLGIGSRVEFAGHVPDIAPWLARADAIILGSTYEGYPAVLVEAIAAGVAVVTTDCSPAIGEIVAPGCGRIVRPAARALAAGLVEVLGMGAIDETERRALAARHDAATASAAWLDMLDRTVAGRSR